MAQASPVPAPDLSRLQIRRAASRPRRRAAWLPWVLLLAVGAAAWLTRDRWASRLPGTSAPAVAVAVVRRTGSDVPTEVAANGYVVARRQAALSTVLSGRLVEVNVEEGDTIREGEVVARIQFDDYDAALEAARRATAVAEARRTELSRSLEASRLDSERLVGENRVLSELVNEARATAERAARDVERNRGLFEKKVIDAGTWDRVQAEHKSATAALDAARSKVAAGEAAVTAWAGEIARRQAALATAEAEITRTQQAEAEARILLDKTYVRAPFTGIVVHKDAEVGEVVASTGFGTNTRGSVATIVDPATLEVQVELAEQRSEAIGEGTEADVHLESAPQKAWRARVRQVWPTADRQKGTVELRAEFVERPPTIKPEMGVRVVFRPKAPAGAEPARVFVPRRAVTSRDGKDVVFVAQGSTVRQRVVSTKPPAPGSPQEPDVEVVTGLSGGERVVLDPPASLVDGAEVTVEGRKP